MDGRSTLSPCVIWGSIPYIVELDSDFLMLAMIAVFGGGAVHFLGELWEDSRRLIIDDSGIRYKDWQIDIVRWSDLRGVFVLSSGKADFVCFTVFDREEFYWRCNAIRRIISKAERASGFGDLNLNVTSFGLSADEIAQIARQKISER